MAQGLDGRMMASGCANPVLCTWHSACAEPFNLPSVIGREYWARCIRGGAHLFHWERDDGWLQSEQHMPVPASYIIGSV